MSSVYTFTTLSYPQQVETQNNIDTELANLSASLSTTMSTSIAGITAALSSITGTNIVNITASLASITSSLVTVNSNITSPLYKFFLIT